MAYPEQFPLSPVIHECKEITAACTLEVVIPKRERCVRGLLTFQGTSVLPLLLQRRLSLFVLLWMKSV